MHRIFLTLVAISVGIGLFAALHLLAPTTPMGYAATVILVGCFTLLFAWISSNFWMTLFGVGQLLAIKRRARRARTEEAAKLELGAEARAAVAMPVYNEDPALVAGNIEAMMESLETEGALDRFDFYILSDSNDPEVWLREEQAWLALARRPAFRNRVFYRRRKENSERKSGNLMEFLENWGHEYPYMLVLDADSVMSGRTLVELLRRMEADPQLALLQTWPRTAGGRTLFARMHQYAAILYGRILMCGIAALINPHGNYWGHNAIIRVDAFMKSCGLPRLPGKEPLGGEILSHDFVEAALLVRRGWKVELAPDLGGSYEEGPPNIVQHIARDQRWCQGNLQHGWIMLARGIHPVSRINLLTGILAYTASPIWLLFVLVAAVMAFSDQALFSTGLVLVRKEGVGWTFETSAFDSLMALTLLGMTVTFILAPKLIGAAFALAERDEAPHRIAANVFAEMILSILVAPTVMLRHSIFVIRLLFGQGVKWSPQQREATRLSWSEAWQAFGGQTLLAGGIAATALIWPSMVHLWLSPILLGLGLSVPIAVLSGRVPAGAPLLLMSPKDRCPPAVLRNAAARRSAFARRFASRDLTTEVLDDPTANQLRRFMLSTEPAHAAGTGDIAPAFDDGHLLARAQQSPAALETGELAAVLDNAGALRRLHLERFEKAARQSSPTKTVQTQQEEELPQAASAAEISQKCPSPATTYRAGSSVNEGENARPSQRAADPTSKGRENGFEPPKRTAEQRPEPSSLRDRTGRQSGGCGGSRPGVSAPGSGEDGSRGGDPQLSGLSFSDPAERAHRLLPETHGEGRGNPGGRRYDGAAERSAESGGSPALRRHLGCTGQASERSAGDCPAGLPGGTVLRGSRRDPGYTGGNGTLSSAPRTGGPARDDRSTGDHQRLRQTDSKGRGHGGIGQ